jgi:MarR family transcriptional regulator, temperature-dependent positive regulator of motility
MTSHRQRGVIGLLTRLAKTAYRSSAEEEIGMTMREYMGLTYLNDVEGAPQGALGKAMHMEPNNLVLLLNDLEERAWIERRRDPSDRRRHLVSLTTRGRKARDRAEVTLETVEDDVLVALSAEEREQLRDLLGRALEGAKDPLAEPEIAAVSR